MTVPDEAVERACKAVNLRHWHALTEQMRAALEASGAVFLTAEEREAMRMLIAYDRRESERRPSWVHVEPVLEKLA